MWEAERIRKRQARLQGKSATQVDTPALPIPIPEPLTKKAQAAAKKQNQSDDVMFGKANETASMALGGKKKKYSWMTGGGGGGGGGMASGASTPRPSATGGGGSGVSTPQPQIDRAMIAKKRTYGTYLEEGTEGKNIQIRDLVHVLENDGRERKTLALVLARLNSNEKEVKTPTTAA